MRFMIYQRRALRRETEQYFHFKLHIILRTCIMYEHLNSNIYIFQFGLSSSIQIPSFCPGKLPGLKTKNFDIKFWTKIWCSWTRWSWKLGIVSRGWQYNNFKKKFIKNFITFLAKKKFIRKSDWVRLIENELKEF